MKKCFAPLKKVDALKKTKAAYVRDVKFAKNMRWIHTNFAFTPEVSKTNAQHQ